MAQRILLDTNVLLAMLLQPERLPQETQAALMDPSNLVWFSAASIWEIAIKGSLGKAQFSFRPEDIHQLALASGVTELPIQAEHTFLVATLPLHHKDPFDRLLVAQAMTLPAHFWTTDAALAAYSPLVRTIAWNA
ncbi:type II toxin-antitoxin system VapC family toxin [Acidithiobacillus sp. IBUN Pt1247-S3]